MVHMWEMALYWFQESEQQVNEQRSSLTNRLNYFGRYELLEFLFLTIAKWLSSSDLIWFNFLPFLPSTGMAVSHMFRPYDHKLVVVDLVTAPKSPWQDFGLNVGSVVTQRPCAWRHDGWVGRRMFCLYHDLMKWFNLTFLLSWNVMITTNYLGVGLA